MRKIKVKKSISINREPEDVYSFWRDFGNLPRFIYHLESVRDLGNGISEWTLKTPIGTHVSWKARVREDMVNERINWQSLPQSDIINKGSVSFNKESDGNGTEVVVHISYEPPPGHDTFIETAILDVVTAEQLHEDLHHLKDIMEKP
jgi:uncharacterized membrane protein